MAQPVQPTRHSTSLAPVDDLRTPDITIASVSTPKGINRLVANHRHSIGFHVSKAISIYQQRDGRKQQYDFLTHDFCVIPAGLPNVCSHEEDIQSVVIAIDPTFLERTAESVGVGRIELLNSFGTRNPSVASIVRALNEEYRNPGLGGQLYIDSLANQLAVHLLRQHASTVGHRREPSRTLLRHRLAPALDYIHSRLSNDLTLDDIAASVGLTPYHFTRLFRQTTGESPHQYVISQRIEVAKRLLVRADLPIADVAAQIGFADHAHLTRHFKQRVGVTPQQYRRDVLRT